MKDTRRTTSSVRFSLPLLFVVLSAMGCVSSPGLALEPVEPSAAPTWLHQPHSWDRLQQIEDWLVGPGPAHHPELVTEAELLLAEGRLRFARDERSTAPASALRQRLDAAEGGFRRVLRDPAADAGVSRRAERGLEGVKSLRGIPATSPTPGVIARASWSPAAPDRGNLTLHRGP